MGENKLLDCCCRMYARMLVLYPPAYRREYGPSCAQLFRDLCRDAYRRSGATGLLLVSLRGTLDLLSSAAREHIANVQEGTVTLKDVVYARISTDQLDRRFARAVFIGGALLIPALFAYWTTRHTLNGFELQLGWLAAISTAVAMAAVGWNIARISFPKHSPQLLRRRTIANLICGLAPLPMMGLLLLEKQLRLTEAQLIIGLLLALAAWMAFWLLAFCFAERTAAAAAKQEAA